MATSAEELEEFVCNEVASLCDADPKVLAQYIIALIGKGERNEALRASLEDKLNEFFEDQTTPFIDRLFTKLNSNSSKPTSQPEAFGSYSDEEDDDGDRNFKHRRQRSEARTDIPEQTKRRYPDDNTHSSNKHFRSNNDDRKPPYNASSGGYSAFDRGRGRGNGRANLGRGTTKLPMCRDYIEKGYCMSGDTCPFDHGRDRIIVEDTNNNNFVPPNGSISMLNRGIVNQNVNINDAYDPERASLLPEGLPSDMRGGMPRRGGFRGGRGGGRGGFRNQGNNSTNTTLVVEKIPLESCQISTVNEFFSKFGTITNISVQSHAQKAIIQYGTRSEAEKAYTCPDSVFGNRFVKVYWHKEESTPALVTGSNAISPAETTETENTNKRKADEPDPEAVAARAAEIAKAREEKHKKHQEHMQAILEIQKKREQQLQQQIEEQKRLFGKLSNSSNMSTEEKTEILKQLKNVQSNIDNSKNQTISETLSDSSNKAETMSDLQKKLVHLEAEASLLGGGAPYSNRGGFSSRGRGGVASTRGGYTRMSLDNRTTKIEVKNIPEGTTEEELRAYFENYGQIVLFEMNQSEALVQYSQRYLAEKAMFYAPNFSKGKLQLAWSYRDPSTTPKPTETAQSTEPIKESESTSTEVL
ncbi:hypothetical protein BY458DRAFT_587720 [Sporodiniella umbellata]|nr:hypothetical protein BY458DRAFT_587720 [Sporodiniella umbellata]